MNNIHKKSSEIREQYLEQAGRAKAAGAPVDINEASAWIHKTPRTLRRWIKEGKVEATKLAGRWVVAWSELNRLTGGDQ
mgnify:CR=1 FL=1|tara:strand:+ start:335 stop:571 length:237 start_codon:yes stop_codon:yes gene_type:complete